MWAYEFMLHALEAGSIVAVLAGAVGYVLVLRGQAFAGHALSHVGFTGATGAALLGWSPLAGMVGMTVLAGVAIGAMGRRVAERDVAIGLVLAVSLGFGLLFLHFFTAYATQATSLLFGDILGIDGDTVLALGGVALLGLAGLLVMARPLLFSSLQPELAEARGVGLRRVSVLFMGITGLAVAACVPVVGVLLVFALMVGPAAAAQRWCGRVGPGVALSVVLALGCTWAGLALAVWTDWPVSFWISAVSGVVFAVSCLPLGGPRKRPAVA